MDDFSSVHAARVGGPSTVTLFLGLFLLVLAFFIILVSISTVEETKSREVMDSLTSTFADLAAPVTDPTNFDSKQGEVLSPEAFQQRITGVFSTAITVDKVEVVQPGSVMRVDFQAHELFVADTPEIRSIRMDLIDRIVTSLSSPQPGVRFEMAFLIGSLPSGDKMLPVVQTLEVARAGAFARQIIERGGPPHTISVGVILGNPSDISVYFYVRDEESARLQFEQPAGSQGFRYDDVSNEDPTPSGVSERPLGTEIPNENRPLLLDPAGRFE